MAGRIEKVSASSRFSFLKRSRFAVGSIAQSRVVVINTKSPQLCIPSTVWLPGNRGMKTIGAVDSRELGR